MNALIGKQILVADDEALIAIMVADMLAELGAISVGPVYSQKQALAALDTWTFEGAILDVNLGDGPSFPVARALIGRNIPCCFATGYGATAIPPEFAATPVLQKPYRQAELADCLEALLTGTPHDPGERAPIPKRST